MGKFKDKERGNILNKKAYHDYNIISTLECGVVLKGHQIKSIRHGMCNLKDSWGEIHNGEIWLNNVHITAWSTTNEFDLNIKAPMKLLAHKKEIRTLDQKLKEKGFTLIPLRFYLKDAKCKCELGLCQGKNLYDKRETLKRNDINREVQQMLKNLQK